MISTVKGRVLGYQPQTDNGTIVGEDGVRYNFVGAQWRDPYPPNQGTYVEFGVQANPEGGVAQAIDIYRATASESKSKSSAGLFAILLGWIGIHKFYLGHPGKGIILILVGLLTIGFGLIITVPLTIIEGLIYLSKSDEDFGRIYVQEKKGWF